MSRWKVAHGVAVMALEVPPALDNFPELVLPWERPFATAMVEERADIQQFVAEEYSLCDLGRRLEAVLRR